jgi:hypothetical protein
VRFRLGGTTQPLDLRWGFDTTSDHIIAGIQGKNRPLKEASLIFFRKLFKMKEEK